MSATTKVRLAKKTLWVASKRGTSNGYGTSPVNADADRKRRIAEGRWLQQLRRDLYAEKQARASVEQTWQKRADAAIQSAKQHERQLCASEQARWMTRALAAEKREQEMLRKERVSERVLQILMAGMHLRLMSPTMVLHALNAAGIKSPEDAEAVRQACELRNRHDGWLQKLTNSALRPVASPTN